LFAVSTSISISLVSVASPVATDPNIPNISRPTLFRDSKDLVALLSQEIFYYRCLFSSRHGDTLVKGFQEPPALQIYQGRPIKTMAIKAQQSANSRPAFTAGRCSLKMNK
jgi:hypothetical protein